ncbi:hypothetical protein GGS20DRAFT_581031 [Poronia punctata]|nr:hypothetical protein GGS20DRAFT_581031 [Poronia punctata]
MVTHSLELPDCISPQGGRLDDFAALMTCFFWFESIDTIQAAEDIDSRPSQQPMPLLSRHTEPHPAFKIWLNSILTTTQVTQNVVLLALLFIYRLKKANPRVHGNPGSEYRLFTVALMLGNKFLDDNTYTNKTWAEVSGLSVKEIHVMEVEFLSNMRYGLLTSKEQWDEWLKKLACYGKYCLSARLEEQAMAARYIPTQRVHVSPNQGRFTTPLPSPTTMLPTGVSATPLLGAVYSPSSVSQPAWDSGYQPVVSPLAAKPSLGHELVRKRSFEVNDLVEPAPKRMSRRPATTVAPAIQPAPSTQESVRLPTPHLTLDTSQATLPDLPQYGQAYYQSQSKLPLPPLNPGMRAMSTVYSTPTSWAPQGSMVASSGPQTPYVVHSNYGTPTKGHSPTGLPTLGSSPMAEAYACHTPMANSPSVYLQQRASPYKPVRRVNTLLNPPPSIPLSEYHLSAGEMHYQPLGRRNDLRTGIVPEFRSAYTPPEHQFLQMFRPFYPGGHDQPHMR